MSARPTTKRAMVLVPLDLGPVMLGDCDRPGEAIEVIESVASARYGRVVLVLAGLHIGDGDQQERVLGARGQETDGPGPSRTCDRRGRSCCEPRSHRSWRGMQIGDNVEGNLVSSSPFSGVVFRKESEKSCALSGIMDLVGDGGGLTIFRGDDGVDILCRPGGHKGENRHQKGTSENPPAHSTVHHERFKAFWLKLLLLH